MTQLATNIDSAGIIGHLIDGRQVSDAARTQPVYNPATGEVTKEVALAGKATVEEAIASARAAYPAWRATPRIRGFGHITFVPGIGDFV